MKTSSCVNCGQEVSTPYCSNCGQKNEVKKITLLGLYHDFQSRIYGFDGMFPRTVKDLTLRPGVVARSFIKGNRVKYVGPVGYFFLMLTLFLLLMNVLEIDFFEYSSSNNPLAIEGTQNQEDFTRGMVDILSRNLRIFFFLLVPIMAMWARIVFRKSGLNWLENMTLVFYVQGHLEWLSILNTLIYYFAGGGLTVVLMISNLLFYAFACTSFYDQFSKTGSFFRGLLVSLLGLITYQLVIGILVILTVIINPDLREMITN